MKRQSSAGRFGIRLHQFLSFSPFFGQEFRADGKEEHNVFFPGCSLMGYSPNLTWAVFEYLRGVYPDIGISGSCCALPVQALGNGATVKYKRILERRLKGVRRVIVCCPNCAVTLKKQPGLEILSIWRILDEHPPEFRKGEGAEPLWVFHDPCPTRGDPETQEAARRVLSRTGVVFEEYPENVTRSKTLCCGKVNMTLFLNPEKGREMLKRAISRGPRRDILTYCFSCVNSFKSADCRSIHGLELVFPLAEGIAPTKGIASIKSTAPAESAARVWWNRWKTVRRIAALRGGGKKP